MNKKVLITGATGFTGGHLCRTLIERGYTVRALIRKTSKYHELQAIGVELFFGDLRDYTSVASSVLGVDVVYHIAAVYREQNISNQHFFDVNVAGTKNLLQASKEAAVQRFVHCSTVGVQGEIKNPPADENAPYNPGDVYQRSKVEGEKLARAFFIQNDLPGVVIRPVGIYGPGDKRFLKIFKYINNGKFMMIGKGEVLYHFTYITDLVDGIILCGEKREALGQIFTIGGNEYLALDDLVRLVAQVLEVPHSKKRVPLLPVMIAAWLCEILCYPLRISPPIYRRRLDFFTKDRAFDISKAKKVLGYKPKVDLKTGMQKTADWYRQHGWLP